MSIKEIRLKMFRNLAPKKGDLMDYAYNLIKYDILNEKKSEWIHVPDSIVTEFRKGVYYPSGEKIDSEDYPTVENILYETVGYNKNLPITILENETDTVVHETLIDTVQDELKKENKAFVSYFESNDIDVDEAKEDENIIFEIFELLELKLELVSGIVDQITKQDLRKFLAHHELSKDINLKDIVKNNSPTVNIPNFNIKVIPPKHEDNNKK